jgi:dihydrofolate synthase/folylpolyglutamate synthase
LAQHLRAAGFKESAEPGVERTLTCFSTPEQAFNDAKNRAGENDRMVVFGSFMTVAGVMAARSSG